MMIITGGLLVATTWDRLDTLSLMKDIMESVLGFPPPPPEMNPMYGTQPRGTFSPNGQGKSASL